MNPSVDTRALMIAFSVLVLITTSGLVILTDDYEAEDGEITIIGSYEGGENLSSPTSLYDEIDFRSMILTGGDFYIALGTLMSSSDNDNFCGNMGEDYLQFGSAYWGAEANTQKCGGVFDQVGDYFVDKTSVDAVVDGDFNFPDYDVKDTTIHVIDSGIDFVIMSDTVSVYSETYFSYQIPTDLLADYQILGSIPSWLVLDESSGTISGTGPWVSTEQTVTVPIVATSVDTHNIIRMTLEIIIKPSDLKIEKPYMPVEGYMFYSGDTVNIHLKTNHPAIMSVSGSALEILTYDIESNSIIGIAPKVEIGAQYNLTVEADSDYGSAKTSLTFNFNPAYPSDFVIPEDVEWVDSIGTPENPTYTSYYPIHLMNVVQNPGTAVDVYIEQGAKFGFYYDFGQYVLYPKELDCGSYGEAAPSIGAVFDTPGDYVLIVENPDEYAEGRTYQSFVVVHVLGDTDLEFLSSPEDGTITYIGDWI